MYQRATNGLQKSSQTTNKNFLKSRELSIPISKRLKQRSRRRVTISITFVLQTSVFPRYLNRYRRHHFSSTLFLLKLIQWYWLPPWLVMSFFIESIWNYTRLCKVFCLWSRRGAASYEINLATHQNESSQDFPDRNFLYCSKWSKPVKMREPWGNHIHPVPTIHYFEEEREIWNFSPTGTELSNLWTVQFQDSV